MRFYYFTILFFIFFLLFQKIMGLTKDIAEPMEHVKYTPNTAKTTNTVNELKSVPKQVLFRKCEKYGVSGTIQDIFKQNDIKRVSCPCSDKKCSHSCEKKWDVYLPCGYNNIEKELGRIKVHNNKQIIFGISGCDKIVSKNYLWKLILLKYGRKKASQLMPDTYLIYEPSDMKLFQRNYTSQKVYILKKNVQRQTGLKITNNLREILELKKTSDFKLVQELLMDPFLLNKRKINLRIYLLIICHGKKRYAFIHKRGFMYYTPKFFVKNSLEREINITSGYVPRQVYEENPLTLLDFKKWLQENNYNAKKII